MKKVLIYIAGIITGVILTFLISFLLVKSSNNGITMFDKPGDSLEVNQFQVFQVVEPGVALANATLIKDMKGRGVYEESISEMDNRLAFMNGPVILLVNDEGKHYYDDEIVKVPSEKYAWQVGIYKYSTKMGYKTVPIVKII